MSPVIFDKKNILVLGGAGFIGTALCEELLKENKVICVDNFSSGSARNIDHLLPNPDFIFINHDMTEEINLEELKDLDKFKIPFQGIQEIYNLACPMSPKHFLENRHKIALANSLATKNALDIALKYKSVFMHFSSSVVYGLRDNSLDSIKVRENFIGKVDFLSERAVYDEGKRFAETLVKNYKDVYGLDVKIVRVFRTYGPRMSLQDDQMIPDFILNALNNEDVVIFGDENFSSALCYVDDVVDAALSIMASEFSGPYNIGSETDVKLIDVAQMIIDEIGSKSKIIFKPESLLMSQLYIPDTAKIRSDLGWMPVVTLSNGLKKTILDLKASKQLKFAD